MIYTEKIKTQLKDIGKGNYIKNRAILEIFENVATYHSDMVGYGPNSIEKSQATWILLDWKLKVLKRPKYGQTLNVHTWGRMMKKFYTYRDFEIYDEENNLCVIGTSKWVIIDINTGKIKRITDEVVNLYQTEEKSVFEEVELNKLKIPENYDSEMQYQVIRRDIDLNGHMHNLYYLDLAYEALPDSVYEKRPFKNVRIEYKKEIKKGDVVNCRYTFKDDEHIVTIYNEDYTKIHSIVVLDNKN